MLIYIFATRNSETFSEKKMTLILKKLIKNGKDQLEAN